MVSTTPRPTIRPVTIGVAGGTGSGKTTVSKALVERIGAHNVVYLPHDSYYKDLADIPVANNEIINFDHPNSLETTLMVEHVKQLQQGNAVDVPLYDFSTHSRRAETQHIEPCPLILIEGILIFAEPALRDLCDVRVFVDIDADVRLIRRLRRDIIERGRSVESVLHQYMEAVRPMHLEFVEPSKRYANVIIPEGGYNTVAIDLVADHVRRLMNERVQQAAEE
ncbi:MAG: uridine kinase [Anaerolineae bacterium]|nr:uridine kinase [Anaerolineae bacterium]